MALHEFLGKFLAAFQLRPVFGRAYDWNIRQDWIACEVVGYAFHKRVFRAYYHHVYLFLYGEFAYILKIIGLDVNVFSGCHGSGVAGCYIQFFCFRALRYLPCQGMFASSRA